MKKLTALQSMHVLGGTSDNGGLVDGVCLDPTDVTTSGAVNDPSTGFTFTGSGPIRPPRGGRGGGLSNP